MTRTIVGALLALFSVPILAAELAEAIRGSGFQELPVRARPAAAAASLPRMAGADFFDRLLIAQAMSEPLRFLTANAALKGSSELIEVA